MSARRSDLRDVLARLADPELTVDVPADLLQDAAEHKIELTAAALRQPCEHHGVLPREWCPDGNGGGERGVCISRVVAAAREEIRR